MCRQDGPVRSCRIVSVLACHAAAWATDHRAGGPVGGARMRPSPCCTGWTGSRAWSGTGRRYRPLTRDRSAAGHPPAAPGQVLSTCGRPPRGTGRRIPRRQGPFPSASDGCPRRGGTPTTVSQANPNLTPKRLRRGQIPSRRMLMVGRGPAPRDIASWLGADAGQEVVIRKRLQLLDGVPAVISTSYYPLWVADGTRLESADALPEGPDKLPTTTSSARSSAAAARASHEPYSRATTIADMMPRPRPAEVTLAMLSWPGLIRLSRSAQAQSWRMRLRARRQPVQTQRAVMPRWGCPGPPSACR